MTSKHIKSDLTLRLIQITEVGKVELTPTTLAVSMQSHRPLRTARSTLLVPSVVVISDVIWRVAVRVRRRSRMRARLPRDRIFGYQSELHVSSDASAQPLAPKQQNNRYIQN